MKKDKKSCKQLTWMAKDEPGIKNLPLDSDIWKFAESWINRFLKEKEKNAAEKFIYLWITVNAWASLCVPDLTKNHSDIYLVHSISSEKRLKKRFEEFLQIKPDFSQKVSEFINLGPIFQVLWMRNNGIESWNDENVQTRREFVNKVKESKDPFHQLKDGNKHAAFAPACCFEHFDIGESIPADWPHVLSMIYQVRCNLFHGGKNYNSKRDKKFIELAYLILWEVWYPELPSNLKRKFDIAIPWERALIRNGFLYKKNEKNLIFRQELEGNKEFFQKILKTLKMDEYWVNEVFSPPNPNISENSWLDAVEKTHIGAEGGDSNDLSIMDTFIAGVVRWLNYIGIQTTLSCDGHSKRPHSISLAKSEQRVILDNCLSIVSFGEFGFQGRRVIRKGISRSQMNIRASHDNKWLLDVAEMIFYNREELSEIVNISKNIKKIPL